MILKTTGEIDMNYEDDSYLISFSGDILKWKIEIVDDIFPYGKHPMDIYYQNVKTCSFTLDLENDACEAE